ncbi:hypothetical protein NDA13_000539 [Ustilago tritici]|nr:hypothetical protein NDA13_000539 [Ustilago tritici]
MLQVFKELDLAVPADINVSISSRVFTVKGPRGSLTKVSIQNIQAFRTGLQKPRMYGCEEARLDWNLLPRTAAAKRSGFVTVNPANVAPSRSRKLTFFTLLPFCLQQSLKHMNLDARIIKSPSGQKIKFIVWHANRKHAACLRTASACVANMIKGVTVGFQYKMRAVYAHFPINIIIAGDKKSAEIRNFLGEKRVRNIEMLDGVTIQEDKAQKDQVLVEGNDIDLVSQSAALLHGATLVRNKDIRKFLDGIYCTGKDTVVKAEA